MRKGAEHGFVERQRAILSFQMMMCGDVEDVEAAMQYSHLLLLIAQVSPEQEKGTVQGVHKFKPDPSFMGRTGSHPARAPMDVTQANGRLTPVELVILYGQTTITSYHQKRRMKNRHESIHGN